MRTLIVLLALSFSTGAEAQTSYKCTDKAGKVTYSGTECHLIGLTPAGEVADRMNTAPAYKAPPRSRSAPPPPPPSTSAPKAAKDATPPPDRRCFVVQTKKGPVTRCNDKPDEDVPPDPAQGREVRAQ